ncbi:2-phosphosulfolactate phosphatase [Serpentinicella alkaliphila]|uniref:Probable 2-phosphosulfolactate phosphatase n=1 Tax=Serpentinicella alkaliphila TaxID=1734049 RepID=A0A4R2TKE2_9FIRM|nr:2-phosphosulfolactate phosphatase [Serpentinicella alkaliphila]QUH26443.1 2-phosphosulfolactate phosphatase [Serpentinicella alkaliphila]TCQ03286.1 2-phosphosulfolactate phosphatase [Serpentinicella alkaliphila]
MNITVLASVKDVNEKIILNKNVVVIDVLRATSVIVTALANRARQIMPFESIEEAKEHYKANELLAILCGERSAKIVEGFHFGNSPLDFIEDNVSNKIIIQTTSNGTRTIKACEKGRRIYIAALINAKAIADQLIKDNMGTVIVCSGTNDQYSMDDAICAGMIVSLIENKVKISMNDLGWAVKEIYEHNKGDLYSFLAKTCSHFNLLKQNGFEEDLHYCLQTNIYDIVPVYHEGNIRIIDGK